VDLGAELSLRAVYRLTQHRQSSHWYSSIAHVTIENFPTLEAAQAAERTAILNEWPAHNAENRGRQAQDEHNRLLARAQFERLSVLQDKLVQQKAAMRELSARLDAVVEENWWLQQAETICSLRARVEAAVEECQWLSAAVDELKPPSRSWWRRLFGRKGEPGPRLGHINFVLVPPA
jgi:hypothetical protein